MCSWQQLNRWAVAILFFLLAGRGAVGQRTPAIVPFQPEVGQQGKDVIWVPTPQTLVKKCSTWPKSLPKTT